ncbi:MAG: hypothetical protein EOP06_01345 [Proteobacteria bacterium]|nr:MAG: hypothetical protein EOP06_01345 [Pseudomonadota bacterium]
MMILLFIYQKLTSALPILILTGISLTVSVAGGSELGSSRSRTRTSMAVKKGDGIVPRPTPRPAFFRVFPSSGPVRENLTVSCAVDKRIPDGVTKSVSKYDRSLCKREPSWWKLDVKNGSEVAYTVSKRRGRIEVDLKIYFNYRGDENNRSSVLKRLEAARTCVQDFYGRFGIKLTLNFKVNSGIRDWWKSDTTINLWDKFGRANSRNWAMMNTCNADLSPAVSCGIAAHELGHTLGLDDLYPDPDCPDREAYGRYDDIMRSGGWDGVESVRLYRNQVQQIISPICGESK